MLLKKLRGYFATVNTKYNTTEDMINKLRSSKGKTKLKFYQNVSIMMKRVIGQVILCNLKILLVKIQKELIKFIMRCYYL